MRKLKVDKRSRLVDSATKLTYEHGFGRTALADIADDAKVPLGNIYYYFKTKAEIGEAVIARQIADVREMRARLESSSPKDRLLAFVQSVADNREALAYRGCPVGTLCTELGKEGGKLAAQAGQPFEELLTWMEMQFAEMGDGRAKRALALHLLSALQGASLLANTFQDPDVIIVETDHIRKWIRAL
jgi:TetR/AcrR family transcriptional regulator, transcriptional repressor for nem operon